MILRVTRRLSTSGFTQSGCGHKVGEMNAPKVHSPQAPGIEEKKSILDFSRPSTATMLLHTKAQSGELQSFRPESQDSDEPPMRRVSETWGRTSQPKRRHTGRLPGGPRRQVGAWRKRSDRSKNYSMAGLGSERQWAEAKTRPQPVNSLRLPPKLAFVAKLKAAAVGAWRAMQCSAGGFGGDEFGGVNRCQLCLQLLLLTKPWSLDKRRDSTG